MSELLPSTLASTKNQFLTVCVTPQTDPASTFPSSGVAACSTPIPIYKLTESVINFTPNIALNNANPWSFLAVTPTNRAVVSANLNMIKDTNSGGVYGPYGPLNFLYRNCGVSTPTPWNNCEHFVDWVNSNVPNPYPNLGNTSAAIEMHVGSIVPNAVALRWTNSTGNDLALSIDGKFGGDNPTATVRFDYYIDIIRANNDVINIVQNIAVKSGNYLTRSDHAITLEPGDSIQFTQAHTITGQTHVGAAAVVQFNGQGYTLAKHSN
ncbi:hypothetical protein [Aeromonas jandaei]|uniref:hypothetical protein n=1 Tax=Aeromonas jandaei TaxID=650 RepID=UPI003EC5EBEE